jgi:hypothetical protein
VTLHSVSELSIHRTGISPNCAASNIESKKSAKENDYSEGFGIFFGSLSDAVHFSAKLYGPQS